MVKISGLALGEEVIVCFKTEGLRLPNCRSSQIASEWRPIAMCGRGSSCLYAMWCNSILLLLVSLLRCVCMCVCISGGAEKEKVGGL